LGVGGAYDAGLIDWKDGYEAWEGFGGVHGVAFYGCDQGRGVFVEEGDSDAVDGASGGVGLLQVERAEGIELGDSDCRVEFGA
jgi:hypothetical protein